MLHNLRTTTLCGVLLTAAAIAQGDAEGNIGDIKQPLWYQPPSAKTLELAKIDDLSQTVVSDGEQGEKGVLASTLTVTEEQAAKIKAGKFTVGIAMGWLGDDWASQQLKGLKETFDRLGVKVVAETNADWDDSKQISNLEAIAAQRPSLLVSIPLNKKTTATAYKRIQKSGTKVMFIDQAVDGMAAGKDYISIVSSDNLALGMYIADELAKAIGGTGDVGALYFANDFYVTNLRYIGFIARLMAKYPNMKLVAVAGHDDPNKGQEVTQALLARYSKIKGLYGSWSIPAMGAATAAQVAGRTPQNFRIVCENFDQIVAANVAKGGFIAGISSQRPYDQGVAEATAGSLALIGAAVPTYIVVPPLAVDRQNLAQAYQTIYHVPLPANLVADLKK